MLNRACGCTTTDMGAVVGGAEVEAGPIGRETWRKVLLSPMTAECSSKECSELCLLWYCSIVVSDFCVGVNQILEVLCGT